MKFPLFGSAFMVAANIYVLMSVLYGTETTYLVWIAGVLFGQVTTTIAHHIATWMARRGEP